MIWVGGAVSIGARIIIWWQSIPWMMWIQGARSVQSDHKDAGSSGYATMKGLKRRQGTQLADVL